MPKVSVIIPNYNHALFLKQRIDSILEQTFQDFELIILDDFSSDKSREIIEIYRNNPKVKHIIYNIKNSGSVFKQWKKGIKLAEGDYIWIAESDDFADIHFIEKLISVLERDELIAMVYSQSYDVDEKGIITKSRIEWTSNFKENIWENNFCLKGIVFLKYLYEKNVVPNVSACLIRKIYLQTVLDKEIEIENFKMCGDWFTWLLIADLPSLSFGFLNEHLNYFRDIDQSTRNHNSKEKLLTRILEEAKIFNSCKFQIGIESLMQKNQTLKNKWLYLYSHYPFSFDFFKIGRYIGASKYSLLKSYQKQRNYY